MMVVSGWSLTGNRIWGNNLEVRHRCGRISGFGSMPQFLKNTKRCYDCELVGTEHRSRAAHLSSYRCTARNRGLEFNLTDEEFFSLTKESCYYCGDIQLVRYAGEGYPLSGLDRIDNSKGYTLDNVRPCCRVCNVAKNNMTEEEWLSKVRAWADRLLR